MFQNRTNKMLSKTKRIFYTTTITAIIWSSVFVMSLISYRWAAAGWVLPAIGAAGAAVALLIIGGFALDNAKYVIMRRGYSRRVGTMRQSSFGLVLSSIGGRSVNRQSEIDFIYVKRDDGTIGQVYLTDLYKCLLADFGDSSVLRQNKWVATKRLERPYYDDMRAVLIEAGVVRVRGNGSLASLHTPGYSLELIKRHYYN